MNKHWSEASGEWYYACDVSHQWDYLGHDVAPEDIATEVAGMHLMHRDGTVRPAPTTLEGWRFLWETVEDDEDGDEMVCVGRVVDGMCVPIGV